MHALDNSTLQCRQSTQKVVAELPYLYELLEQSTQPFLTHAHASVGHLKNEPLAAEASDSGRLCGSGATVLGAVGLGDDATPARPILWILAHHAGSPLVKRTRSAFQWGRPFITAAAAAGDGACKRKALSAR